MMEFVEMKGPIRESKSGNAMLLAIMWQDAALGLNNFIAEEFKRAIDRRLAEAGIRVSLDPGAREPARLKAQGVKAGVPDLFLPVAKHGKHGLFIEMKRRRGGRIEPEQKKWIASLLEQGYEVFVCKGADAAIEVIKRYLEGEGCVM